MAAVCSKFARDDRAITSCVAVGVFGRCGRRNRARYGLGHRICLTDWAASSFRD